jgi:hypothetical protein
MLVPGWHSNYSVTFSYPTDDKRDKTFPNWYSFYLNPEGVAINLHHPDMLDKYDLNEAFRAAFIERDRVFSKDYFEIYQKYGVEPFEFRLHYEKLLDDDGKPLIAPNEKVLTVEIYDSFYLRASEKFGSEHTIERYIDYDQHQKIVQEAVLKAQQSIRELIRDEVQRGIGTATHNAISENILTLNQVQEERESIAQQIKNLQAESERLEIAEKRMKEREQLEAERRAAKEAAKQLPRDSSGYVYVLKEINGNHYKIGRTNNPENRAKTFGVKLPFRVEYTHLIKTDDMFTLESELHYRYHHCRIDGEWFALTESDLNEIKGLS